MELIFFEILYIIGDAIAKNNLFIEVLLFWFLTYCNHETEQRTALQWNMGLGQGARATVVWQFPFCVLFYRQFKFSLEFKQG